jgi:nucleoside-diphosphate-sugar epimerase
VTSTATAVAAGARFYADELERLARSPTLDVLRGAVVVVVGATGMLGRAVTGVLGSMTDVDAIGIARRPGAAVAGMRGVVGSATDPATYKALPPADYVLYVAGETNDSAERPWETVEVTLNGLQHAVEYARTSCRKFVFVSSTRVYGPYHDQVIVTEDTRAVGDVMAAGNLYDGSKRLAESLLLIEHQRRGLPACGVRLANIYGPHLSNPRGHFVGETLSSLARERRVVLRGHPESTRNYCFVTDAAQGLLFALARGTPGLAYNIASREHLSNLDFIRLLAAQLPFETAVDVPMTALARPCSRTTVSIARAEHDLDYMPRGTLAVCLPFVADWTLRALGLPGSPDVKME